MKHFFREKDLRTKINWFNKFRFPYSRSVYRWLFVSGLLFAIFAMVIGNIHLKTYRRYKFLKKEYIESEKKLSGIQKKIKKVAQDEKDQRALMRQKSKLKKQKLRYKEIVSFLTSASSLIPGQTWLDRLLYSKSGVVIEGYSPNYQQVLKFYTSLAKLPVLKNCCLKYNQKSDLFRFKIKSELAGGKNASIRFPAGITRHER